LSSFAVDFFWLFNAEPLLFDLLSLPVPVSSCTYVSFIVDSLALVFLPDFFPSWGSTTSSFSSFCGGG